MALTPEASVDAFLDTPRIRCFLTYQPLDVQNIIASVQNPSAGAIATFIGTTRNSFKGKTVTHLEYQAYSKIAIKTMFDVAHRAMESISSPDHDSQIPNPITLPDMQCSIHHRLGTVPIGEPSIVIAVSSPHRKEAFIVCEEILEEVKKKAQIWKREYYEGESESEAEWKVNT